MIIIIEFMIKRREMSVFKRNSDKYFMKLTVFEL